MNSRALTLILAAGVSLSMTGATLTAPPAVLFGRVIQAGEGPSYQVYEGELTIELVRDDDPNQVVSLAGTLSRIGHAGELSYRIEVPLRHFPSIHERSSGLEVTFQETSYSFGSLTVNGQTAYPLASSPSRVTTHLSALAPEQRLDLRVNLPQVDSDADGMPDWWEQRYGLNPRMPTDGEGDLDGDGLSNRNEWLNATDPTVPNIIPVLQTTSLRVPSGGIAGFHVGIIDLDTPPSELTLRLLQVPDGLTVLRDLTVAREEDELSYAEVLAGRVRIGAAADFVSGSLSFSVRDGASSDAVTNALTVVGISPGTASGIQPAAWLEAGSLTPLAAVDEWADRSGNKRDAYQPLGAAQPRSSEGAAGVRFERSAYLYLDDRGLDTAQCTVLLALEPGLRLAAPQTVLRLDQVELAIGDDGAPLATHSLQWGAAGRMVRGPAIASGRGEQLTMHAGAAGAWLRSVKGYSFRGGTALSALSEPAFPTLGATHLSRHHAASDFFEGIVHEVVIFDRELDPFSLTALEDYLQSRWGRLTVWDFRDETVPVRATGHANEPNGLIGGWGGDHLTGGTFADVLRGGPGDDRLTGMAGPDRFQFFREQGHDTVTDFNPAEGDVLDLTGVFHGIAGKASDYIRIRHTVTHGHGELPRAGVVIELDHDGANNGWAVDQTITLENPTAGQLTMAGIARSLWLGALAGVGNLVPGSGASGGDDPEGAGSYTLPPSPEPGENSHLAIRMDAEGLSLTLVTFSDSLSSNLLLQHSPDLHTWSDVTSDFTVSDSVIGGNLVKRTYTRTNSAPAGPGFYRVQRILLSPESP